MKKFLFCLMLPVYIFSAEVRECEFNYLIDREIHDIDEALLLLTRMDPFDGYTYYWLLGMKEGLYNARCIFNECIIPHSGCK